MVDYKAKAYPEYLSSDSLIFQPEETIITKEDIELAYKTRGEMRERLYAEVAMNTAIKYGMFSKIKMHTIFMPTAEKAATEHLERFWVWAEQLRTVMRRDVEGGQSLCKC